VSVEPGQLADDGTLDLDDRDPDGSCMQDDLLEGVAPLRHDKELHHVTSCDERLFNGAASGDDLFTFRDESDPAGWNRAARGPRARTATRVCRATVRSGAFCARAPWPRLSRRTLRALLVAHSPTPPMRQR
jgi:hypothetical protein